MIQLVVSLVEYSLGLVLTGLKNFQMSALSKFGTRSAVMKRGQGLIKNKKDVS